MDWRVSGMPQDKATHKSQSLFHDNKGTLFEAGDAEAELSESLPHEDLVDQPRQSS